MYQPFRDQVGIRASKRSILSIAIVMILAIASVVPSSAGRADPQGPTPAPLSSRQDVRPAAADDSEIDAADDAAAEAASRAIGRQLSQIVGDLIPAQYEDDSKWGLTKERPRGLKLEWDGGKLETRRRYGVVNHGLWKRWSIEKATPPPSEASPSELDTTVPKESLRFAIDSFHREQDGRYALVATVEADVACRGQMARWAEGVQLMSVSAEATMTVTATVRIAVAVSIDFTRFPPPTAIVPEVQDTTLALSNWRLRRVSKLGRDLAEPIGDWLEGSVRRYVAAQGERATKKINEALARRQGKLQWNWEPPAKTASE